MQYLPGEVVDVVVKDGGSRAEVHCEGGAVLKARCVAAAWALLAGASAARESECLFWTGLLEHLKCPAVGAAQVL